MKDYFFKPPINQFSLNFLDQELERSYRSSYQEEVRSAAASQQSSFFKDTFVCVLTSARKMKADVAFPQPGSPALETQALYAPLS